MGVRVVSDRRDTERSGVSEDLDTLGEVHESRPV